MTAARDKIIDTTCALIEIQGYHATGLNQIISESGSPKGSLYYYFPGGKEELVSEALVRTGETVLARIRGTLASVPDAAEAVHAFMLQLAFFVESSGYQQGGAITTVALETASTSDRLRTDCMNIYESWRIAFEEKLLSGGIEPARAARLSALILASIEGGIILSRTRRTADPIRDMSSEIRRLIQMKD